MATETTTPNETTASTVAEEAKSFMAQAQEKIGEAVDATVTAVKEHPVAAAAIAAGAAAAVGGAAYAASQYLGDKPAPSSAKTKK